MFVNVVCSDKIDWSVNTKEVEPFENVEMEFDVNLLLTKE